MRKNKTKALQSKNWSVMESELEEEEKHLQAFRSQGDQNRMRNATGSEMNMNIYYYDYFPVTLSNVFHLLQKQQCR